MIHESLPQPLIFLACHGSRDRRYGRAFEQLVQDCREQLHPLPVAEGQLELAEISLSQQLVQAIRAHPQICQVIVIPLFLGGGVHVDRDLPEALQQVSSGLSNISEVHLIQAPPLGLTPGLLKLLQDRIDRALARTPAPQAAIVIGHGSRAAGFAQILEGIVEQLVAPIPIESAYWAQDPQLPQRLHQLYGQGHRQIQILPCFLFPGGILDQIHQLSAQAQRQYPDLQIRIGGSLAPDPLLIQAILSTLSTVTPICRRLG